MRFCPWMGHGVAYVNDQNLPRPPSYEELLGLLKEAVEDDTGGYYFFGKDLFDRLNQAIAAAEGS